MQYEYNLLSQMTKITDRRCYEWDYEYGTYGTIIKVTFPDDNYVEYGYDDSGNKTSYTDARGYQTQYIYDNMGRLTQTIDPLYCDRYQYYDDAGNLIRTKDDFDNETFFYYTVLMSQVKEIKNDLGNSSYKWYDANGNLTLSQDFEGNQTQYEYDDANRLVETIDAASNSTLRYYDKYGRVTKITDARGNDTEMAYDVLGHLIRKTDALGNVTEYQYNALGYRTKVKDARGYETEYTYDVLGRLIKTTDPFDNYVEYEYDANGNLIKVIDKLGNQTEYTYNSRNMRTAVTNALDQETVFSYDANGNMTAKTVADDTSYAYVYDALNRQIEATDPLGHTNYTYYSSVGTITRRKDAEGNETFFYYDDLYHKTMVKDAEGNETEYQFDKNGKVTKIIDGRDKDFQTTEYNCLKKIVKQTDALGRYSEFTYDPVGNLSTKKDPLGNTTTFTYDAVNRLVNKQYQDSSWVGYEYDANGNMVEASDGTVTFEFTYDAENKPTKVRDDTEGLEVEYAYDANGNLLWIEDTSNNKVNYYYNALNAVVAVTNGSTFATIEYATCCSLRTKLTYGNGCYAEYDYDHAKRLTKITNRKSNGTVISSWEYAYDDVGNVTSETDKDYNVTSYTYDDIYQLTHVNYPSGSDFGYEYDAVGNRTKMYEYTSSTITTTYTFDDADELTQYTTSTLTMTFTYASDGCLKTKSDGVDTWTYGWDYERRLNAFSKNSAMLVEYGYNPTGTRRYSSDSTLGLTNYFHSLNHTLGEYSSGWALEKSYVPGLKVDESLAMVDRRYDPNVTHYLTGDRLGSTRELVGSSDTVYTQYAYDAWGAATETQLSGSISSRFLFNGWSYAENESEYTGGGISYSPEYGRLTAKAPAGGGLPTQMYALSNPGALEQNNPASGMPVPGVGMTPTDFGPMDFPTYWLLFFYDHARDYCWVEKSDPRCRKEVRVIGGPLYGPPDKDGHYYGWRFLYKSHDRCFGSDWYGKACCQNYACCIFCTMMRGANSSGNHREACETTEACCVEGQHIGGEMRPVLWCGEGPDINDPHLWDYCYERKCFDRKP